MTRYNHFLPHDIFLFIEASGRYNVFNITVQQDSGVCIHLFIPLEVMVSQQIKVVLDAKTVKKSEKMYKTTENPLCLGFSLSCRIIVYYFIRKSVTLYGELE